MKGILIIAHGSRREQTKQTMDFITEHTRTQITDIPIVSCYMEFASPNVEEGLTALKNQGVTTVVVVPYFLFEGIHIKEDIPEEIEKFTSKNPEIEIVMGETLGKDPRLADILAQRIKEAL